MSIQTRIFVDGAWITQTVDIHHVIAQNREPHQHKQPATPVDSLPQKPPLLGLLSQTLTRSPLAKWIIPARIRHESKNDVIFIFENYIEIYEINKERKSGLMKRVATKGDLDSTIRSARVFGLPRKCVPPSSEDIDDEVKEEVEDEESGNALQLQVPPHILVLALDSKILAFIFAFNNRDGQVQFLQCRRPLPVAHSSLEQLGEFLAIDPKAMAVAAHKGSFSLYALKPMDEIRSAVQAGGSMDERQFQPVKEERHIHVEGQILKMEFLYPPEDAANENRVILLLVIFKDRKSKLACYEWDSSTRLATASLISDGPDLRRVEWLPLLLVPLMNSTSFMLVSNKVITVYKKTPVGHIVADSQFLATHDSSEEFAPKPTWIQWARPIRHDLNVQNQDNIYLCRQDGLVYFLEIKHGVQVAITIHYMGNLGANIDTSFASVDLGYKESDLLVLIGDGCDGGGWLIKARQSAKRSFVITNWTSTVDFTSTFDGGLFPISFGYIASRREKYKLPRRLFTCTGRGKDHGGMTEARFGIQGTIDTCLDMSCSISQIGVTRVWVLDGFVESKDLKFILLSYPTETSLTIIGRDIPEHDCINIDLDAATLAVGASKDGLIIQVTTISLRATLYGSNEASFYEQAETIAACVRVCESNPGALVLLACFHNNVHFLRLVTFTLDDGKIVHHSIGIPLQLPDRATCISIERVGFEYFAFVGTVSAALNVFRIHLKRGLSFISDYKLEGIFPICDSVAMLGSIAAQDRRYLILCGLRNGCMEVLRWDPQSSSKTSLVHHEKIEIGNTSITILTDIRKPTRAILLCDQKLHTAEHLSKESTNLEAPLLVNNVYVVDPENVSFQQGMIDAMTQSTSGTSEGLLFCVDDKNIQPVDLSLEADPSLIPRRIAVGGTPRRAEYSAKLDKLMVLQYSKDKMYAAEASGRLDRTDQHYAPYSIAFVDLNSGALKPHQDEISTEGSVVFDQFQPGEIPLGITEWFPSRNDEIFHVFVVNTLQKTSKPRQTTGRIYLFKQSASGTLVVKKVIEKDAPVFALTPYGSHSLLYACGSDLCLHSVIINPSFSGWKFGDCMQVPLFSRALYISVDEPSVYVSTSGNSLFIFKVVANNRLDLQFVDEISRRNRFHLTVPQRSLVVTCQTGRSITGLWVPSKGEGVTVTSTVFEARLPGSITRLHGIHPPPWKKYLNLKSSVIAVGSTIDGSFFQFSILDENAWRLLAFIQTLALRTPFICPFVNPIETYRRPLEPSTNPSNMHINGDIVRRILDRGGESSLIELMSSQDILKILLSHELMLRVTIAHHHLVTDEFTLVGDTQNDRTRLATEIAIRETQARRRIMWKLAQDVGLEPINEKDLVVKVVHWITCQMQKVI